MHPAGLILPKQASTGSSYVTANIIADYNGGDGSSYPGSGSTWYDLSPTGRDLTLSGTSYDGTYGSIDFSGSGSYSVAINQIGLLPSDFRYLSAAQFSIEIWLKGNNFGAGLQSLAGQGFLWGSTGTTYWQWRLVNHYVGSDAYIQCYVIKSNTERSSWYLLNNDSGYTSSFANSTWYQFVFTYDGTTGTYGTWTAYQNGSDVGGTDSGSTAAVSSFRTPNTSWDNFTVGASMQTSTPTYYRNFNGNIAIFRIYDAILSSTDVAQNWDYHKATFGY